MAEALVLMVLMSLLMVVMTSSIRFEVSPVHQFPSDYLFVQSQAMAAAESYSLSSRVSSLPNITFNAKGNVSKAMTLRLDEKREDIIIELGPGKLVFR